MSRGNDVVKLDRSKGTPIEQFQRMGRIPGGNSGSSRVYTPAPMPRSREYNRFVDHTGRRVDAAGSEALHRERGNHAQADVWKSANDRVHAGRGAHHDAAPVSGNVGGRNVVTITHDGPVLHDRHPKANVALPPVSSNEHLRQGRRVDAAGSEALHRQRGNHAQADVWKSANDRVHAGKGTNYGGAPVPGTVDGRNVVTITSDGPVLHEARPTANSPAPKSPFDAEVPMFPPVVVKPALDSSTWPHPKPPVAKIVEAMANCPPPVTLPPNVASLTPQATQLQTELDQLHSAQHQLNGALAMHQREMEALSSNGAALSEQARRSQIRVNQTCFEYLEQHTDYNRKLLQHLQSNVLNATSAEERRDHQRVWETYCYKVTMRQSLVDEACSDVRRLNFIQGGWREELLNRDPSSMPLDLRKANDAEIIALSDQMARNRQVQEQIAKREGLEKHVDGYVGCEISLYKAEFLLDPDKFWRIQDSASQSIGSLDGDPSAEQIDRLAGEHAIPRETAHVFLKVGARRQFMQNMHLWDAKNDPFLNPKADVPFSPPAIDWDRSRNLDALLKPLPDWTKTFYAFTDRYLNDSRFTYEEVQKIVDCEVRCILGQGLLDTHRKSETGLHLNSNELSEGEHYILKNTGLSLPSGRPSHLTQSDRVYFANFEKGRAFESGSFCMLNGKIDQDARAEMRKPAKLYSAYIGGISNRDPNDYRENVGYISQHSPNRPIRAFYNSCGNVLDDLAEVRMGKEGCVTRPVLETAAHLRELFATNPDANVHLIAHSQGCLHLKNVLLELPHEYRMKIDVTAIGPATFIEDHLCNHVRHFASTKDHVAKDGLKGHENEDSVEWMSPAKGASMIFDHEFLSPTYKKVIEKRCEQYSKKYA